MAEFKKLDRNLFLVEITVEGYTIKYKTVPVVICFVLNENEDLTAKQVVRINFNMAVTKIDELMKGIGSDEQIQILERL